MQNAVSRIECWATPSTTTWSWSSQWIITAHSCPQFGTANLESVTLRVTHPITLSIDISKRICYTFGCMTLWLVLVFLLFCVRLLSYNSAATAPSAACKTEWTRFVPISCLGPVQFRLTFVPCCVHKLLVRLSTLSFPLWFSVVEKMPSFEVGEIKLGGAGWVKPWIVEC